MDKYEYKLKTDQMLELMKDGAYNKAAEIADAIDWKRVRNTMMLGKVSEIYEKSGDYRKSYDVLRTAYNRAEGSRKIVSQLCTLALKTKNVDEAIDYYDDFIEIAPKDPNQYILKYQILHAQRAPLEQQIHALEEFKKAEYREEWAYELAKLYQAAGMTAECLEECDDLILWFSEGKYVYQAMELKMQYKPLTPFQQEKYDRRYEEQTTETAELPDLTEYKKAEEPATEQVEEELEEKLDESEKQIQQDTGKRKIGNTMKLDEALKSLLNITIRSEEPEPEQQEDTAATEQTPSEQEEDDLSELEEKIVAIESVADLGFAAKVAEEKRRELVLDPDLEELKPEMDDPDEVEDSVEAEASEEGQSAEEVKYVSNSTDDDQIQGQMSFMDFLDTWEEPEEAEEVEDFEEDETEEFEEAEELEDFEEDEAEEFKEAEELEDFEEDETEEFEEAEEFDEFEEEETEEFEEDETENFEDAEEFEEDESEDFIEEEAEAFTEDIIEETADADFEEENIEERDSMEDKKKETPILSEDIQRLIDEIEGNVPAQEEAIEPEVEAVSEEELFDDYEELEEEFFEDDFADEYEEEEYDDDFSEEYEEEEYDDDFSEEYEEEEYDDDFSEEYEEEEYDDDFAEEYEEEEYDDDFSDEYEEEYDEDLFGEYDEEHEEELISQTQFDEIDDREIPDEDEDEIDLLSATTPLSRKETAKMIATGKTAPLPLDEISDALSMSDTGFIMHARYDLKTQSGVGTRAGLTEEQKKLFSYFVPVRGMSEQLVDVLEQDKNCTNRKGTSATGNLLIIGNKGNGKTVLAVDVVKAIQKQRKIRQGKVAIVTGDSLNKKKISDIVGKLYGGALIIEKAGKMNEKTVTRLNKAMENDTGEMLIVLEDQRKPLDRLLTSNREFRRKFTSRLEVPVFINDELVTFGQTYAQENGYRIDEMGILALYSRIDSLQREDHAVTIAEVKEIMDEAMEHSKKASAKKLVKRVFGKNTDDSDRIILTEKDFNI